MHVQGEFKLNRLFVGDGAVLCAHTRLLSGAAMSERSTLLEHTLVVQALTFLTTLFPP